MLKETAQLEQVDTESMAEVLILILMEHAQRDKMKKTNMKPIEVCLNPYFNGTCSKSLGALICK